MDLFVRESGPPGAPTIVFLHGGRLSGWSWEPVVELMQQYRCLVPDLPQYGKSSRRGPFAMSRAADAVASLIRSRAAGGVSHVVGFSLGAQVGLQLLATEPAIIGRAVLCGTIINSIPGRRTATLVAGRLARTGWFRQVINRRFIAREMPIPTARIDDYRNDQRLCASADLAHIVVASAGFTLPSGLAGSATPTLFLTGAREAPIAHRWAAACAQRMPNGIDRFATGMRHDWPLRNPDLFAAAVDGWLSGTALPPEIRPPDPWWRMDSLFRPVDAGRDRLRDRSRR